MVRSFKSKLFSSLMILACLAGCHARLRVDVSVYKGPIIDTAQGRLDKARGLAKASRDVAAQLKLGLLSGLNLSVLNKDLIKDIVTRYDELKLSESSGNLTTEQEKLLKANLINYGDYCQSVAQRIGYHELSWFLLTNTDYLAALIDIDENGRIISVLINSIYVEDKAKEKQCQYKQKNDEAEVYNIKLKKTVDNAIENIKNISVNNIHDLFGLILLDELKDKIKKANQKKFKSDPPSKDIFLTLVNNVMASQAPGGLVTAIRNFPWLVPWTRRYINSLIDNRYWDNINTIEVSGSGKFSSMLVKDQIGNWHLKALSNDPTEIINSINQVAQAAINAYLATQGAVPSTPSN